MSGLLRSLAFACFFGFCGLFMGFLVADIIFGFLHPEPRGNQGPNDMGWGGIAKLGFDLIGGAIGIPVGALLGVWVAQSKPAGGPE